MEQLPVQFLKSQHQIASGSFFEQKRKKQYRRLLW
jgi:hypothetical protein